MQRQDTLTPTNSAQATQASKFGPLALPLSILAVIALVFSWLVLPYAVNGTSMLSRTGEVVKEERRAHATSLSEFLTRGAAFPGGITVKALYANEDYFEKADRGRMVDFYQPDANFVFFITEDVHTGLLPVGLPKAALRIGGKVVEPSSIEGPEEVSHHRMTIVTFPKFDETGALYLTGFDPDMRLILSHSWDRENTLGDTLQPVMAQLGWENPLTIPPELLEQPGMSSAIIASLSIGLLAAVLTPCLLQLSVIFMATMSASGAEAMSTQGKVDHVVKRRVLVSAAAFVLGYVILFTIAGALIGGLGKQAQIAFSTYYRPIGIVSGTLVILFGIWLGIRSNAPVLCNLPGAKMMQRMKGGSTIGNVTIAIVYNLGCMSCFGGAIIATLFIYVGALGSAWVGAVTMGAFALGLGIPFMAAALFFTRMEPLIMLVSKHSRAFGLVGALVVIGFGVLLLTDNFHTLSDAIYPYLGLN
ncbi:cytochrome c biogenesis protein CcdA [Shimia isoporae]|uniref:Cytochrome c biogenesis protein CcdA n=1 Tax=Shimia isoporae TaxID=647720 RepID=A0A4R1NJC3_9RHOB|nr:cytochrome c biogenesis protein CcdA [Shimia isoporae]TCL08264.1 cytochrome c biogenesis protein CcdA [Shimia isoporae]